MDVVIRTLLGHKSNIRTLDFHLTGDFLASGSVDTNIKVTLLKMMYLANCNSFHQADSIKDNSAS